MLYAWNENFVLPFSHDEVVHGKGSMMDKLPGDAWQKAATLRALYAYMYAHPGKKLLFMGSEFGQWREWNHDASLDWHLLEQPLHAGLQRFVEDLNKLYRARALALSRSTSSRAASTGSIATITNQASSRSSAAPRSRGLAGRRLQLDAGRPRAGYRVGVPAAGLLRELLNSDACVYGGSNVGNEGGVRPSHSRARHPQSVNLTLPPLSGVILKRRR